MSLTFRGLSWVILGKKQAASKVKLLILENSCFSSLPKQKYLGPNVSYASYTAYTEQILCKQRITVVYRQAVDIQMRKEKKQSNMGNISLHVSGRYCGTVKVWREKSDLLRKCSGLCSEYDCWEPGYLEHQKL